MALIAIASDKGAPGVTTAALALAAVWPRPVLLAECDQAGGDLVYRFPAAGGGHLDPRRGVLSLAVVARRGMQPQQVWEHVQKLHGGLDVLAGVTNAEQGAGLSLLWGPIGKALAALPQADVIADCGRLGADGPLYDLLVEATTVVLVSKVQVADVIRLRDRAAAFAAAVQTRGRRGFGVGVVVIAEHKKFRAALGEVQHVLGQANAPATVLGGIAHDTKGADLLSGEWGGSLDRTMLIKTAREVAAQLVHSLPPIGGQAEASPGYPAGAHAGPQPPAAHAVQQAPGAHAAHAAQQVPGAHAAQQIPGVPQPAAAYAAAPVPPPAGRRHAAPAADAPPAASFSAPQPAAASYNGQPLSSPQVNAPQLSAPQLSAPQLSAPQLSAPQLSAPQPPRPAGPWQIGQERGRQEPAWSEPGRQEPGRQDPAWSEPGRQELGRLETGRLETGRLEPGRQDPAWSEPGRQELGRPQPVPAAAPDLAGVTLSAPPLSAPPVSVPPVSGPAPSGSAASGPTISADAPRTTFSRVLGGRGGRHQADQAQSRHQADPAQSRHQADPAQSRHQADPAQVGHAHSGHAQAGGSPDQSEGAASQTGASQAGPHSTERSAAYPATQAGPAQSRAARHAAPTGGRPGGAGFSRPPMPPMPPLTPSAGPRAPADPGSEDGEHATDPGWGAAPWQWQGPLGPAGSTRPGGE
jgi:MinD-like ATPase involved in chromosome partitioning or flagellar assembly